MSSISVDRPTRRVGRTASGQGEAYWFYGDLAILRSPEGAMPVIIEHRIGPGGAAPLHVHPGLDDSFFLVAGRLAVRCGEDVLAAEAGDYVSLPMGVPHSLRVLGDEDAVLLQTHANSSFLDFIRAVGTPAARPRPEWSALDIPAMNEIAARTGHPVIGPPMTEDEAAQIMRSPA